MTPLNITLRGAIGIQAGLGRDEIFLDLAEMIPGDAVTVAIKGDNGAGKSTLMNLGMSPWLNPPQLPGSIYDHFGAHGERTMEWEHDGETYRSAILYHQTARTQKTTAHLHVMRDGEWEVVRLPDNTVSDGKARTYSACLAHVLGPQSIYYLSAFRAQNAPRLADYDDPKGLMQDLLQLDEPNELAEQASTVRLRLEQAYLAIRDEAKGADEKLEDLRVARESVAELDKATPDCRRAKKEASDKHTLAKAEHERAVTEGLDQERARQERKKQEALISDAMARAERDQQGLRDHLGRLGRQKKQISEDAEASAKQLEEDLAAAKEAIERGSRLRDRSDEIYGAAEDLKKMRGMAADLDERANTWKEKAEEKRLAGIAATEIGHTITAVVRDGKALKEKMESQQRRAGYVDQVPCHGRPPYEDCPALQDAIRAAKDALETDDSRQRKLAEYHRHIESREKMQDALEMMGNPEGEHRIVQGKQRKLQEQIDKTVKVAALLPMLEQAEEDIKRATTKHGELADRLGDTREQEAIRLFECTEQEAVAKQQADSVKTALESRMVILQRDLDAMPPADESDAAEHTRKALQVAEDLLEKCSRDLDNNIARLAQNSAQVESLQRDLDALSTVSDRAKYLDAEVEHWDRLSKGMRGVIDHSIEDAGPGIADYANKLLRDAYGPRFTLRIVTQRQNKTNGVWKEIFDISVIDADSGGEASIVHKSGGETVWLDKALTDAVALYHQEAAGVHFGTLFADEAEDGLTEERKQQFYRMDRSALEMGKYSKKFTVSHNPGAWALSDAVIDLEEYRLDAG